MIPHETDDVRRMQSTIAAHALADDAEIARLRALSMEERAHLIYLACEAAEQARQARLAAGLGDVVPDPWPASTWEFLRKQAAKYVSTRSETERS